MRSPEGAQSFRNERRVWDHLRVCPQYPHPHVRRASFRARRSTSFVGKPPQLPL